ncbi:MAG: alpha/beta hydrolase [Betaproteobacteria bacterium]|nr:alpha/beta hydrolase [Betaproteobacteria bacterium]NBO43293.1 alpha/beta hydrolase [Betaproteobacteria bacterium]NBP09289.1 alpha/beta hydrolase [Betaproteobacteria bacterium]NBP60658.1 alpha/beta hydrolase [Betaproteobacteria bacterium]NBQ09477.1 alpha/beta hydrolase [Betaproteobacteria bacterium]
MELQIKRHKAYAYTGGKAFRPALPTVLFIHGAQNDHSVWIMQSRWLAHHGYNVLAVDLPAHGRSEGPLCSSIESMAAWCCDVLTELGVQRSAWIGHSMGSLIALEAAATRPEQSWANVLLGSAFPMQVSDALLQAAAQDEASAIDMITRWSHSGITHVPGTPGPGFSVYNQGRRLMERQAKGVLLNDFKACNDYALGLERALATVQPTLLLSAALDLMTPPKSAQILAKSITGSRMQMIEYAGHQMMAEQPDRVRQAISDFLSTAKP